MDARLYGNDPDDGVGGTGAFFLLIDEPEVYGFPPDPVVTTKDLPDMFRKAGARRGHAAGRRRDLVRREGGDEPMSGSGARGHRGRRPDMRDAGPPVAAGGRRHAAGAVAGGGDRSMVPEATFTSYYGRPIVKPSPWEADIPAYLFAGGLAAGSSLIAAGADLTGRPTLRRVGRLGAIGALTFSMVALVHDLGRPIALPQHAPGRQADLADVGGHLDPVGVRPVRRRRRRHRGRRACCRPTSARGTAHAAGAVRRPPGRAARRGVRAAGRLLHRGAALRHRDAVVARGLPGAAVRLRRLRRRGGLRARPGHRADVDETGPVRRLARRGCACWSWPWSTAWSSRWASRPSRCTPARRVG